MIHAQYTEVLANLMDNAQAMTAITTALSYYPLYEKASQEEYIPSYIPTRQELNDKILNHYKYREIGFETFGRWLDELKISMNEIMPRYNQLFFSADQDYNILFNVDYQRTIGTTKTGTTANTMTGSGTNNETATSTGTSTATATDNNETNTEGTNTNTTTTNRTDKNVSSLTPQNILTITAENIDSVPYADEVKFNKGTDAATGSNTDDHTTTYEGTNTSSGTTSGTTETEAESQSTATANGTTNDTENTIETTRGNFGVMATQDLITKYRDLIRNIEQEIINDPRIQELFMLVW